jgi:hypothetical protein
VSSAQPRYRVSTGRQHAPHILDRDWLNVPPVGALASRRRFVAESRRVVNKFCVRACVCVRARVCAMCVIAVAPRIRATQKSRTSGHRRLTGPRSGPGLSYLSRRNRRMSSHSRMCRAVLPGGRIESPPGLSPPSHKNDAHHSSIVPGLWIPPGRPPEPRSRSRNPWDPAARRPWPWPIPRLAPSPVPPVVPSARRPVLFSARARALSHSQPPPPPPPPCPHACALAHQPMLWPVSAPPCSIIIPNDGRAIASP